MTSTIKVNNIQNQCGANIINENSNTITIGASGDTIALASGASQTGFGRTGTVDWQTTPKTATFTAASGEGYFCNTSGGAFTVNLPSSPSVGDIVAIKDYGSSFDTQNLTIGRGGSNMNGTAADSIRNTENESLTLVYADATKGWLAVEEGTGFVGENFIVATGGTITCSGDYKIHTFTGPGTFTVSSLATCSSNNAVDYLVVAGGGSGGWTNYGGGGGAGGFRLSNSYSLPAPTTSPLANPTGITASVQGYPITVGGGGANPGVPGPGTNGSNSIFSTITSAGGGGGINTCLSTGNPGGSGGGGLGGPTSTSGYPGGAGNTPPVSPPQGNPGGAGYDGVAINTQGGSGGGAGAAGGNAGPGSSAPGGIGSYIDDNFIGPTAPSYGTPGPVGSTRYFAGGGGGAADSPQCTTYPGGAGGGGTGGNPATPISDRPGTVNTGGGAGGGDNPSKNNNGGSGIVMIRYKFQ